LPWLCPKTDSLIALADAPATVPGLSAADPAMSLFLLRFAQPAPEPTPFIYGPGACLSSALPDTAAAYLAATPVGPISANSLVGVRAAAVAQLAGLIAARLAETTQTVSPEAAAITAKLAPLGWYAVAAVDPATAVAPFEDGDFAVNPVEVQTRLWGLDHAAVTRRLAARWRLPCWVATTIGCLTLPLRVAGHLASHRNLFAVVQLAVLLAEERETSLSLVHGADRAELMDFLRLDRSAVEFATDTSHDRSPAPEPSRFPDDPRQIGLLSSLLRHAAHSRRRAAPALVIRLEEQIDLLHRVAAELGDRTGERLHEAKLAALAELAAGAGHEINNPLAVISGTAQRLFRTEPDPERGESLQTIVRQTHRIAGILRDLMQFARPSRPEPGLVAAAELLETVREDLAPFAADRGVRLELAGGSSLILEGDPKQLQHSLRAVVRNAVEATPPDGWVRVTCEEARAGLATITVEDSGVGLSEEALKHAFDPFFSGRSAGRGRGLGLPTAWRLAHLNGGDLQHTSPPGGPTRFTFTFRRHTSGDLPMRRSA
jgi:signal transduction histidine kinase